MNTIKKIKIIAFVLSVSFLAISCLPKNQSMDGAGTTILRYTPGDQFAIYAIKPLTTPQVLDPISFRKDIPNAEKLATSTTITLTLDADGQSLIKKYNTINGTDYIAMPASLYTIAPAASDGKITLNYAPGDFEKSVVVTIPNAMKFDFSAKYLLALKVTYSGEGNFSKTVSDTIYRQVLAINKLDGVYEITGKMVDLASAAITGNYPSIVHLVTTGEFQVAFEEVDMMDGFGVPYRSILSGGNLSGYGSFGLIVNFDSSNKITSVVNYFGQPANTRSAELDPTGVNEYDPGTQTIKIKYFMKQPSVVTTPPYIRTTFDETWTYTGPR